MWEVIALNGENLARLVDNLKKFAADYGVSGRGARYVIHGNKLLNEGYLARDPSLLPKILNQRGTVTRIDLPLVADRIETKTNARIFGFRARAGKSATVKILMRYSGRTFASRQYGKSLLADIRARKLAAPVLARVPWLIAPRILAYESKHGRWIVEEYIAGKRAGRSDLLHFAPLVDVAALYRISARLKPVYRRPAVRQWAEWLRQFDPEFPRPPADAVWPEALNHRDLEENLLRTPDGRLCVIDWELARVAPVAVDLVSLYYLNPDLKPLLVEHLRRLDPTGTALAPELQLALCLMRHTKNMMRNPAGYVAAYMKNEGISHQAATSKYEADKKGVRDFLAFLRAP